MRRREFISLVVAATTWPLTTRAEQMPVVGFLNAAPAEVQPHLIAAFGQGLAKEGYVEGKNLTIEYHYTNFKPVLMQQAANDVVRRKVNVIFASTPDAIAAARSATSSIPTVAVDLESDPIANGYIKSLARPGGNLTGMFLDLPELSGKQVGLLKEIVPRLSRLAVFGIPSTRRNSQQPRRQHRRSESKLKLLKCRSRMTGGLPWKSPKQGRSKPVFCCRRLLFSFLQSKSPTSRWLIGSRLFSCSPNFQKPVV